jgi:hypothetical protein
VRAAWEAGRPPRPWESHLWRLLAQRLRGLRELLDPPPDSYVHELDENYLRNPDAIAWLGRQLDAIAEEADDLDVCSVMLIHPVLSWLRGPHPFARHYEVVEPLARSRGFEVVRGYPAVAGERDTSLWVSPYDPHPNARGHELLAAGLAEALGELPERCWKGSHFRRGYRLPRR